MLGLLSIIAIVFITAGFGIIRLVIAMGMESEREVMMEVLLMIQDLLLIVISLIIIVSGGVGLILQHCLFKDIVIIQDTIIHQEINLVLLLQMELILFFLSVVIHSYIKWILHFQEYT